MEGGSNIGDNRTKLLSQHKILDMDNKNFTVVDLNDSIGSATNSISNKATMKKEKGSWIDDDHMRSEIQSTSIA